MSVKLISLLLLGLVVIVVNSSVLDDTIQQDYESVSDNFEDGDDSDSSVTDDEPPRKKRQISEAMQRSLTNNPVGKIEFGKPTLQGGYFQDLKNFGGRVGGSAGAKVWQSGRHSVGLGVDGAANVGLHRGSPYANSPAVGAGLGYHNGRFSATAGVGNLFNRQKTYGLGLRYRFRRSADEQEEDNDFLEEEGEDSAEEFQRQKRQISDAMQRSLTNNPVGKIDFGRPTLQGGYFQDMKNFGGRVGGSAGAKVWESGRQSVGLGVEGAGNVGLHRGSPYANTPSVGTGIGYQNGRFSATAGVGNLLNGPKAYGVGVGYRFKRAALEQEDDEYLDEEVSSVEPQRKKRQTSLTQARQHSLTNNPVGQIEIGKPTLQNGYFDNLKNFGGRVGGSAGVKVLEHGRHNLGLGVGGQANLGLSGGRPFANSPEIAAGLGYQNGPLTATVGAGRTQAFGQTSRNYGAGVGYQRGPWSATVDAGHTRFQGRGSTNLGAGLGYQKGNFGANLGVQHSRMPGHRDTNVNAGMSYRWKRSIDELEDVHDEASQDDSFQV